MLHWFDAVGQLGVVAVVGAFALLQSRRLTSENIYYLALNAVGAAMVMVSLAFSFNLSAFLIECFWLLISAFGLLRHWRARHQSGN